MGIGSQPLWRWETTGTEQTAKLFDRYIFKMPIQSTGQQVRYDGDVFYIYKVVIDDDEKIFAMSEVSNGVYAFLVQR